MIPGLPDAVNRHLEAVDARQDVTAVSCAGTGSIHQAIVGRAGMWLPLTWELQLRPARSFAWHARTRVAGVLRRRLSEEYRAGRGQIATGSRRLEGDALDRTEYALLWAWTAALAPAAAARVTGVTWERLDASTARMLFPHGSETWESTLRFDPATGLLRRFETKRFELRAGFVRSWAAELDGYREFDGIVAPARVTMAWEDDPAVRLELAEAAVTP